MRHVLMAIGAFVLTVGCDSKAQTTTKSESFSNANVLRSSDRDSHLRLLRDPDLNTRTLEQRRNSEILRKEIGAPEGWWVEVRRHTEGARAKGVILQLKSDSGYRLAVADFSRQGPLFVRIDFICRAGYTTYCERMFDQAPTDKCVEKFAADYACKLSPIAEQ